MRRRIPIPFLGAAVMLALPAALLSSGCGSDHGSSPFVAPTRVVYVLDNNPSGNHLFAYKVNSSGQLSQIGSPISTGGYGTAGLEAAPTNYFPHDKDNEIISNPQHTLLFVANPGIQPGSSPAQGTISVFKVSPTGSATLIGTTLSGGSVPVSMALIPFSGGQDVLVVANRDELANGIQGATSVPNGITNNYVTFLVNENTGALTSTGSKGVVTATPEVFAGITGITQVIAAPQGLTSPPVVFGIEEGDNIRSMQVGADGTLTQTPGSPFHTPADNTGPYVPAPAAGNAHVPLGADVHPTQRILYVNDVKSGVLLAYQYNTSGVLTFAGFGNNVNGFAACWVRVDARNNRAYTSNTLSDSISVFDLTNPTSPTQLPVPTPGQNGAGNFILPDDGDPYQIALDPNGQYLYVTNPRNFAPSVAVPNRPQVSRPPTVANNEDVLAISPTDGTITGEVSTVHIPGSDQAPGVGMPNANPNADALNVEGGFAF